MIFKKLSILNPLILSFLIFILNGCSLIINNQHSVNTVKYVDLSKYVGTWYEIASYPNRFQKNCVGTKATYTLNKEGTIEVLNECFDKNFEGKLRSVRGKAYVVDYTTNAKLKVTFRWPFYGDYWIIDLGDNYEYAVVSGPKKKYLWILSRTKFMDAEVFNRIIEGLKKNNFDTTKLTKTSQR